MKNIPQHLEEQIFDYLDGKLQGEDRQRFELDLRNNPDLFSYCEMIRFSDQALRETQTELPSKNFTERVMAKLDTKPVTNSLSIRNGILLFIGSIVIMMIALFLVSSGMFNEVTPVDLNKVNFLGEYLKQSLPRFSIDGQMIVKFIVLLNLVLAFILLDRTILKPLFQRRINSQS